MASFETLKKGRIRASVYVNGIRDSKTWPTAKKARSWAQEREIELKKLEAVIDDTRTFKDLFSRYSDEVSSKKDGAHWEKIRLTMLMAKYSTFCALKLVKSKREDIEHWINSRLAQVKPSTVNRELNLISHTLTCARRWRWMSHNPMEDLKRPKNPPARFRRISEIEIQQLRLVLGYRDDITLNYKREFVCVAFLFAIETAMRAGEICSLTQSNIDVKNRVAHLSKTKNGDERDVPLSNSAIELINRLPKPLDENTPIFQLTPRSLSSTFRKYRLQTTIKDLTFHDSRHEATTRLADKLHVLELAAVTGHRNINELLTYYNKTARELALKINTQKDNNSEQEALDYSLVAKELMKEFTKLNTSR